MHAIVLWTLGVLTAAALVGWSSFVLDALTRLAHETLLSGELYASLLTRMRQQLEDMHAQLKTTHETMLVIGTHLVAVRATLESVVRVEPPAAPPDLSPHLRGLAESVNILHAAVRDINVSPDDIRAQIGGLAESVQALRQSEQRRASVPRMTALEAPQVPKPHGEAKTLLLLNENHSVAHEVTWHRDVPKTYSYGGRVFELLGANDAGQWEFLPC